VVSGQHNNLRGLVPLVEAARELRINPESLRRIVRARRIRAERWRGRWLIDRAVLDEFAARYDGRVGVTTGKPWSR